MNTSRNFTLDKVTEEKQDYARLHGVGFEFRDGQEKAFIAFGVKSGMSPNEVAQVLQNTADAIRAGKLATGDGQRVGNEIGLEVQS